ncbi:uncharacterized protein LOC129589971 [Paramacrobiotus metropolitanus]|uniref:uncharacterized protein LOC129589971 n=1 Tax=Paramacrobiotus metropolitanus TaxID=2943436 RepID=UPI0024458ACC|nr:uncharacterized protein LOC129589971 [Paramacrobiotus metropolitanus]
MPKKKAGQRHTPRPTARTTTKPAPPAKRHTAPGTLGTSSPRTSQSDSQNITPVNKKEESRRARLDRACKRRNANSGVDLDEHFRIIGLQIRRMTGDGNCMFRAFGDQLEGNENNHRHYRTNIVEHITKHKEQYDTFHELEEEKNFDIRLKKLSKNGTFGGQECLVAFARAYNRLVFVHQPDEKITLQLPPNHNVDPAKLKQVHLLYTGGNHYDSIRLINDASPAAGANVYLVSEHGTIQCSADTRPNISASVPEDQGIQDASQEFDDDKNAEDDDGSGQNADLLKHERDSGLGSLEGSREPSISSRTDDDADVVLVPTTVNASPEFTQHDANENDKGFEDQTTIILDESPIHEDESLVDKAVPVSAVSKKSPKSDNAKPLSKKERRRMRRAKTEIPQRAPSPTTPPPCPVTELSSAMKTRMVLA